MSEPRPFTRHLTPSFIISVLALVIALSSGAAVAGGLITGKDIKDNSVSGTDIKNGSLALGDLNTKARTTAAARPLWAIVDADGTILRGNGIVSVSVGDVGQYVVTFDKKVTESGVAVAVINEGVGSAQVNWRYCSTTVPAGGSCFSTDDVKALFVDTEDSTGANVNHRFSVVVMPPHADFTPAPKAGRITAGAEGR